MYDKVDYLSSLGKTQTAAVQRDADIGVAEAERDAGIRVRGAFRLNESHKAITTNFHSLNSYQTNKLLLIHLHLIMCLLQEAECKREMMDVKFLADTKMADSKRELEMQKASFNQEVNTKVKSYMV